MRVLLISANTERINMPAPPLGLGHVAAAARAAGHQVSFLDLLGVDQPLEAVRAALASARPEVIGLSIRNIDDQELRQPRFLLEGAREVIAACRQASSAPIVLGGAGYSLFPDAILDELSGDYGIRGDGEQAFPALLDRLGRGEDPAGSPGVHLRGRGGTPAAAPALDEVPGPEAEYCASFAPETPELWVPVQSRRGCPNRCAYCSTAAIQGTAIRCRPVRAVIDEVSRLAQAGYRRFYFVDNAFNQPSGYALELCRRLEQLEPRVTWRAILYPHQVSEELVDAMAAAGCVEVALGFESGSAPVLRALNKRFGPDEVRQVADLLAARGIRRMGFLLLGGPGETRQSVEESLAFTASLDLELVRVTVGLRIYPETELARRAAAEGVIAPDDDLLRPRFYLAPDLEPWIWDRVTPGVVPGGRLR